MLGEQLKADRVAIDFGTTGTGIACHDRSSKSVSLVKVNWNVTGDYYRFRLPAAMLVTQFEERVDIHVVGFDDVSTLRSEKKDEGRVISSRHIAAPKLLLDPQRCNAGEAREDALYLKEVGLTPWSLYQAYMERILRIVKDEVDIGSIETWCLTVPVMYTKADEASKEMQGNMTDNVITAAKSAIGAGYKIDDKLEFEAESVAVMAHLATQPSQSYKEGSLIGVVDAGGSTVDVAFATMRDGALVFISATGASAGTYYMWEAAKKACTRGDQSFSFVKHTIEEMKELCGIENEGFTKETVHDIMYASYRRAFTKTDRMLSDLQRKGYPVPTMILVGRAPAANPMIRAFLVSELQARLKRVFEGQTIPAIVVPEGLDAGASVCRGAALPYSSDPVQAFTKATVAVCYQADGGRKIPKSFRGKDNALVVIKDAGVERLSGQWRPCLVDGPPEKFEIHLHVLLSKEGQYKYEDETSEYGDETNCTLYCYPKLGGLSMNALRINLEGHARAGDRIEYRLRQPNPEKPTDVTIDVKFRNGTEITTLCELFQDRERLQLRLVEGCASQDLDDDLQAAARGRDNVYDAPDSEPEEGSSVPLPLRVTKRGQGARQDASSPGGSRKRRRLPGLADG